MQIMKEAEVSVEGFGLVSMANITFSRCFHFKMVTCENKVKWLKIFENIINVGLLTEKASSEV